MKSSLHPANELGFVLLLILSTFKVMLSAVISLILIILALLGSSPGLLSPCSHTYSNTCALRLQAAGCAVHPRLFFKGTYFII